MESWISRAWIVVSQQCYRRGYLESWISRARIVVSQQDYRTQHSWVNRVSMSKCRVTVPTKRRLCVCTNLQETCLMETEDKWNRESALRQRILGIVNQSCAKYRVRQRIPGIFTCRLFFCTQWDFSTLSRATAQSIDELIVCEWFSVELLCPQNVVSAFVWACRKLVWWRPSFSGIVSESCENCRVRQRIPEIVNNSVANCRVSL